MEEHNWEGSAGLNHFTVSNMVFLTANNPCFSVHWNDTQGSFWCDSWVEWVFNYSLGKDPILFLHARVRFWVIFWYRSPLFISRPVFNHHFICSLIYLWLFYCGCRFLLYWALLYLVSCNDPPACLFILLCLSVFIFLNAQLEFWVVIIFLIIMVTKY